MASIVRAVLWSSVLAVSLGMLGCKSDTPTGGTVPTPPTPPVVASVPTASFIAAATANAFDPVTFDATASSSTDGSALQYVWDFGNGQRGGGKTITRTFGSGGARSVTLTVFDGANRSGAVSKTITIAAPPAAMSTLSVQGVVKALDSTAIGGVSITQVGGTGSATTDSSGSARLMLGTATPLMLKFSKSGYADQFLPITLPATTGSDAAFAVVMRTRDAALTLSDATAGGSLTGRDGALITLPANALVNATGGAVTGAVQISITPVDVTQPAAGGFPGRFDGLMQAGTATPIVSFGTTEYVLTAGGQNVQVAPGRSATIELPLYATKRLSGAILTVGDTTPLWSLDETTGTWVQEGKGTVVASASAPSGLALRAAVTHFSWWNSDLGFDPTGAKPKCVYDTNIGIPGGNDTFATATICNMLAEMDRGAGAGPRVVSTKSRTAAAAAVSPAIAGFSSRTTVPIAGGVIVPVPANVNVRLTGTALNGTWGGSTIVNGPVGVAADAIILMRPLFAVAGPTPEAIALPFDGVRSLAPLQSTALFTFNGAYPQYARIQLSPANGSVLSGRVRLLQGTTVLGSATITGSGAQLITALPSNGTFTLEIGLDAAGAFRLQVDLLGGLQTEALSLPLDVTRSLAQFSTYNGTFSVASPTTIYVARRVSAGAADVRVLSPTGAVLLDGSALPDTARGASLTLPAAGTYTLELRPRVPSTPATVRAAVTQTLWKQIAPTLDTVGILALSDAIADRNGKVVVGVVRQNGQTASRLTLQRWTGTAWEAAAADLVIEQPCSFTGNTVRFTFDSQNRAVVLAGIRPASGTAVSAWRFNAGTWQVLGANNGTLPRTSTGFAACNSAPAIAIGGNDAPLAAYPSDNGVVVQRFDGAEWKGLAQPDSAGDTFPLPVDRTFDLQVDATNRIWLVTGSPAGNAAGALARRFNTSTLAWETIGSLPSNNVTELDAPRMRFDAAGQPFIAWIARVASAGGSTKGTAVDRFDGVSWSSTGGFVPAGGQLFSNTPTDIGLASLNGDAVVSWTNVVINVGYGVIVQRNTATGWTPIGTRIGEVPQFTVSGPNDVQSINSRLVAIGNELYLVLISFQGTGVSGAHIVLLQKLAN